MSGFPELKKDQFPFFICTITALGKCIVDKQQWYFYTTPVIVATVKQLIQLVTDTLNRDWVKGFFKHYLSPKTMKVKYYYSIHDNKST